MIRIIKDDFKRLKELTLPHVLIAIAAAILMSVIGVQCAPIGKVDFSAALWLLVYAVPFISMLMFYIMAQKPERSVFCFVKYLYYIAAPFILVLLTNIVFDPNKSGSYLESFFSLFLPLWTAVWLFGMIALYVLMCFAEHIFSNGARKNSFMSRLFYALAVMFTPQKFIGKQKVSRKGKWAAMSVCIFMVAVGVLIGTITLFLYCVYSNMEFEAILFTMRFAAGGLAVEDLIAGTAILLIFLSVTGYISFHIIKCFRNDRLDVSDINTNGKYTLIMNGKKRAAVIVISAVIMLCGISFFSVQTGFMHYMCMKLGTSNIYETSYIKPDNSIITFCEKKNNLIYIYLESMENTYASKEAGGAMDKNYISELTELTKKEDSVSFSNTDKLGGPSVFVPSITFTMGSTIAQTTGISLNTHLLFHNIKAKFPNTPTLEDILHDNGYNQLYIEGSKGEFSMYDVYVGRYDNSRAFDRKSAADEGYSDESADYIWKWGIEDQKLIEITKDLITDMSKKDEPFFVTMYTLDTHSYECGHRCPNCDDSIKNDYLASVNCTSRLVTDLVDWIKQQPYYENTTIILIGDHLGNKKTSMVDFDDDYLRTTYNCIINPVRTSASTNNRIFSSLDMFPTTLSAIGADIKGDRLGLGTDLFSKTPTLCEELGEEEYKLQLEQDSDFYNREFY